MQDSVAQKTEELSKYMVGGWCRLTALDGSFRKIVFVKEYVNGRYRVIRARWDDEFVDGEVVVECFHRGLDFCYVGTVTPMEKGVAVLKANPAVKASATCFVGNWSRMPMDGKIAEGKFLVDLRLVAFGEEQIVGEGSLELSLGEGRTLSVFEQSRQVDFPVEVEDCKAIGKRWRSVFRAEDLMRVHKMYWLKLSRVEEL